MSMAYYEPGSGWNLPPGCFDDDPDAPWNQVDEPACGDCAHCIEGCCEVGARLDRRTLQGHAGGLVQTVRWIAASCAALLVAVVALELYVIRTLAAGLVVLALLACG